MGFAAKGKFLLWICYREDHGIGIVDLKYYKWWGKDAMIASKTDQARNKLS